MTRPTATLATMLPRAAGDTPDATAVIDLDRTWSFARANREAGQIAAALGELGVGTGDRVGVHLEKCGEGFVAMHGVVRAGAVAVPLDPASPGERLARTCRLLDISVIVSHEPRRSSLIELCTRAGIRAVVGLEERLAEAGDHVDTVRSPDLASLDPMGPADVAPGDRAYVITTSGSTGEPKGIVHTHRSAMAYAGSSGAAFDVTSDDRVADIAPHHFDISTFALWTAPLHGASIVVVREPHQILPASHSSLLADAGVTIWYSVPFLLQQLVARGDLERRDLSALRVVKMGGEVIPASVVAEFMRLVPSAVVVNVYGPAEVNHCSHHLLDGPPDDGVVIPIGRPWPAARFRVAEPGAEYPAPESLDEGELWVASATMMEGYYGATAAESNIVEMDGDRWYRTGDLVTVDADGVVTFRGRVDLQVKVRGHRVELEGIEVVLEELGLADAIVATVVRDADGDRVVAGVIEPGPGFRAEALIRAGRERLPAYAAPVAVVTLNGKKFTGSGKLDRRVLRGLVAEHVTNRGRSGAPSE